MSVALVARRTVFGLLLATSLYLFLAPVSPDGAPAGSDKVAHAAIFATLTLAGWWAGVRLLPLAVGLTAYAATTEVLQAVLPLGRRGDPADFLADVVGVGLGLVVAVALTRARRGRWAAGPRGRRAPSRSPG